MNPRSHRAAGAQAAELLKRHFRGASQTTRKRRYRTAEIIASRIWCRWQVGIYRWRQKHIRWYLMHALGEAADNTRYSHFLVITDLIQLLGRDHWLEHLDGPWVRPTGAAGPRGCGRPRSLKIQRLME